MTFIFSDMQDFAKWLKRQAEALQKQADSTRNVRQKAYASGQAGELNSLARLILSGELVIGEPKKPKQEEKEEAPPRPSAANNDFLMWVRGHYAPRLYQKACEMACQGATEEKIRRWLSEDQQVKGDKSDEKPGSLHKDHGVL
jgi:hypothetical protein